MPRISCSKGHIYDSAKYSDKCPFCPNGNPKDAPPTLRQCKNGHRFYGDYCPYCRNFVSAFQGNTGKGKILPVCSNCRQPLRKGCIVKPSSVIMSGSPWNEQWDGKCEHCGFDYNLHIQTAYRVNNICVTTLRHPTSCDTAEVISGIEIETVTKNTFLNTSKTETLFLSTEELKYIIDALNNSPVLKQFDWGEDWT
jgi:hypothetical protein